MKQHLVASGSRLALVAGALALGCPAAAQDNGPTTTAEPAAEAENVIVVSGVRQSIESAIDDKRNATEIKDVMKKSRELGMQTFDQSLFQLYEDELISYEDALRNADSVNDLRLQIKLNSQRVKTMDLAAGTEHLTIV